MPDPSEPFEPAGGDTAPLKIVRPQSPEPFGGHTGGLTGRPAAFRSDRSPDGAGSSRPTIPDRSGLPPTLPARPDGGPLPPLRRPPVQNLPPPATTPAPPSPASNARRVTPPQRPPGLPPPVYPARQRRAAPRPPDHRTIRISPGRNDRGALGCFLRLLFMGLLAVLIGAICGVSAAGVQYYRIAQTLPDIADLSGHASQFETTRILDRDGNTLYELMDPNAGRRTYIPLEKMSPYLLAATIATEDKGYYSHPGFDVTAIVRAFIQNNQAGGTVSGASTITQQLARNLLFTPEERGEQTYERKVREAILASEITRRYSKNEILEIYLNEIYYGNLSYGIEAAAETYFRTTADKLTLSQAAFLAGLPQSPAVYDIYTNPEATLKRHKDVLTLMNQLSAETGCIEVSNSPQRVCVDVVTAVEAATQMQQYSFPPPDFEFRYPHWVTYVRSLLEAQYDPQTLYRLGYTVYTTLDPAFQDYAQAALAEQVAAMAPQNAKNGALVAIRPATGEILAMIGSPDFYNDAIAGQINMAISPRQPGSAIKPLTYAAAFEKGWTPATLIWDVPSEFPPSGKDNDPSAPYVPVNYDNRFHGPVTVRIALANSYNIPAVKTLQFVGIYDDPEKPGADGLIAFARRLGINTLDKPDYGLSLTLGGGEVTLLDLTTAYAAFANSGRLLAPVAISKIVDRFGNVVFEYQPGGGVQAVRPEHAYLLTSILSDNAARTPGFGADSPLHLAFPAAAKTGTTNDFRDNWTLGYTPDLAVGVWIGNADYSVMQNTTGLSGAAPVWNRIMSEWAPRLAGGNPTPFVQPSTVIEQVICDVSGAAPSQWCPKQRSELFAIDQPAQPADQDLWQKVLLDTWSGLRAAPACADFLEEKFVMNVTDPWGRRWVRQNPQGIAWAEAMGFDRPVLFTPERECRPDDPHPTLVIAYPTDSETIRDSLLNVYALIDAQDFEFWRLDAGAGDNPVEWTMLAQDNRRLTQPDIIAAWDIRQAPAGQVATLRLRLNGAEGRYAERRVRILLLPPTPTPTPLPTATSTPPPTWTPWPTPTNTPTTPAPPPPVIPTETPTPTVEVTAAASRLLK